MNNSDATGFDMIAKVQADFPRKKVEVLPLNESVYNFYNLIEELPKRDEINILFVTGLEYSFDEYEQEKKELGWNSEEIYSYSWRGVPPVLMNVNQQRERFLDNFKICFVFLLPKFAIEYFIHRAPDFFDWRSSLFKFSMDKDLLQLESMQACWERGKEEDYLALTPEARKREFVRIQGLIDEDEQTPKQKAELFYEQALLYGFADQHAKEIADYDKALEIKPDDTSAFYNKACCYALHSQIDQAIQNLQQAINLNPDKYREMAKTDSDFDSMRSHPKFQELIQ